MPLINAGLKQKFIQKNFRIADDNSGAGTNFSCRCFDLAIPNTNVAGFTMRVQFTTDVAGNATLDGRNLMYAKWGSGVVQIDPNLCVKNGVYDIVVNSNNDLLIMGI
jgi:hypothetical protein